MHGGALLSLIGVKHLTLTSWFFFLFFFSPLFGSSCVFQIFDNNFTLANPSIHICHRKAHWAASLTEAQFPPKGRSLQTKSTILPFLCPLSMFDCFQILLFIFSVFLFLCPRKEKNEKHTESVTHTHTQHFQALDFLSLSLKSLCIREEGREKDKNGLRFFSRQSPLRLRFHSFRLPRVSPSSSLFIYLFFYIFIFLFFFGLIFLHIILLFLLLLLLLFK